MLLWEIIYRQRRANNWWPCWCIATVTIAINNHSSSTIILTAVGVFCAKHFFCWHFSVGYFDTWLAWTNKLNKRYASNKLTLVSPLVWLVDMNLSEHVSFLYPCGWSLRVWLLMCLVVVWQLLAGCQNWTPVSVLPYMECKWGTGVGHGVYLYNGIDTLPFKRC